MKRIFPFVLGTIMLRIDAISFGYDQVPILEDIHFTVSPGEHVSIIGESGCGKSTLLKIIYGLLHIDQGEIHWNNTQILGPNFNLVPGEPYMKYLSQDFNLMPFTSVEENVGEFLSVFEPKKREERTAELLEMIQMTPSAKTKVKHLSQGQQQRVALAKVLAEEPELLLLDEPFSHIDNFRKNSFRRNLFGHLKEKGVTVLVATHDHNDMLPFADTAVVLKDKHILAKNTPKNLYQCPNNLYIASLFGEANLIPIDIVKSYANTKKHIIVYAHEFKVSKKKGLQVVVKQSYYKGDHYMIAGIHDGKTIYFNHPTAMEAGAMVFLNISIDTINQRLNPKPHE